MTDTPATYPAECTISDEEFQRLKKALTNEDNDDWRTYTEQWPPTDEAGNVYPIWFTVDELNSRGELVDSFDNNFSPFTGNCEPLVHDHDDADYCNAPLKNWRERYPNIRYCAGVLKVSKVDGDYCHLHRGLDNVKTAEEHLKTGLNVASLDHLYGKLAPTKKMLGWGIYESLMGESIYEFAVEYREETLDFSDEDFSPIDADDDGSLTFKAGYPTQHSDAALSLFTAAMMRVQVLTVQPRIMYECRDEGEGMMESKTIETAQLTAPPSEHDPSPQQFETLETWSEHHLNLPLSRLFNDMEDALKRGGVVVDPESDENDDFSGDVVLNLDAEGDEIETEDDTGTDPNQWGDNYTSKSQEIVDATNGDMEGLDDE